MFNGLPSGEVQKEYKAKLRNFMERNGKPVRFEEYYGGKGVSTYGWGDYDAQRHILGVFISRGMEKEGEHCRWVIDPGAELREESYSQFAGTEASNNNEVGINVYPARCACGKYQDVTLRYVGTLTDVLHDLLGLPRAPGIQL